MTSHLFIFLFIISVHFILFFEAKCDVAFRYFKWNIYAKYTSYFRDEIFVRYFLNYSNIYIYIFSKSPHYFMILFILGSHFFSNKITTSHFVVLNEIYIQSIFDTFKEGKFVRYAQNYSKSIFQKRIHFQRLDPCQVVYLKCIFKIHIVCADLKY